MDLTAVADRNKLSLLINEQAILHLTFILLTIIQYFVIILIFDEVAVSYEFLIIANRLIEILIISHLLDIPQALIHIPIVQVIVMIERVIAIVLLIVQVAQAILSVVIIHSIVQIIHHVDLVLLIEQLFLFEIEVIIQLYF